MRLRLLFTLGLALCMTAMAAPKECPRCRRHSSFTREMTPATAVSPVDSEHSTLLVTRLLYI